MVVSSRPYLILLVLILLSAYDASFRCKLKTNSDRKMFLHITMQRSVNLQRALQPRCQPGAIIRESSLFLVLGQDYGIAHILIDVSVRKG